MISFSLKWWLKAKTKIDSNSIPCKLNIENLKIEVVGINALKLYLIV